MRKFLEKKHPGLSNLNYTQLSELDREINNKR